MIIFDCFQGASADMLLGALLSVHKEPLSVLETLRSFSAGSECSLHSEERNGLQAYRAELRSTSGPLRTLEDVTGLTESAELPADIKEKILSVYSLIFGAEGAVHGKSPDKVHLHELASPETFLEILGFIIAAGPEKLYVGPLPLGKGSIETAHGIIPVPAPATLEILRGMTVYYTDSESEMVTPTAAALLRSFASEIKGPFLPEKIGYGLGSRSVLRAIRALTPAAAESMYRLECNVDDRTAEDMAWIADEIRKLSPEVYTYPVLMKKGRSGYILTALADASKLRELAEAMHSLSGSSGLRYWAVERSLLKREETDFRSSYGICRMKKVFFPDGSSRFKPEYDDLCRISREKGIAVHELRNLISSEYADVL